jgi:hypothetical protein
MTPGNIRVRVPSMDSMEVSTETGRHGDISSWSSQMADMEFAHLGVGGTSTGNVSIPTTGPVPGDDIRKVRS